MIEDAIIRQIFEGWAASENPHLAMASSVRYRASTMSRTCSNKSFSRASNVKKDGPFAVLLSWPLRATSTTHRISTTKTFVGL